MKHKKFIKIAIVLLFAVSIFMSWGRAANEPDCFRPIGVMAALLGYEIAWYLHKRGGYQSLSEHRICRTGSSGNSEYMGQCRRDNHPDKGSVQLLH